MADATVVIEARHPARPSWRQIMFGGVGIWLGLASLIVGVALGLTRPFPESWVCASIGVLAFVAAVGGRLAMIPQRAAAAKGAEREAQQPTAGRQELYEKEKAEREEEKAEREEHLRSGLDAAQDYIERPREQPRGQSG